MIVVVAAVFAPALAIMLGVVIVRMVGGTIAHLVKTNNLFERSKSLQVGIGVIETVEPDHPANGRKETQDVIHLNRFL